MGPEDEVSAPAADSAPPPVKAEASGEAEAVQLAPDPEWGDAIIASASPPPDAIRLSEPNESGPSDSE